jgi:hypothetical protein
VWFSDLGTHLSHAHLLTLVDINTAATAAEGVAQEAVSTGGAAAVGTGPFDSLAKLLESTLTVRSLLRNVNSLDILSAAIF